MKTDNGKLSVITVSPDQTRRLGMHIGRLAEGNQIYLLTGNLGTGKTHLVQGIAFGLGIDEYACSPSFMIAREYHGRLTLYHLDLYRLERLEEIADLGLDEYFRDDSLCAIEWADKGTTALPGDNLTIRLAHLPGDKRSISFVSHGKRYDDLIGRLKVALQNDGEERWNLQ